MTAPARRSARQRAAPSRAKYDERRDVDEADDDQAMFDSATPSSSSNEEGSENSSASEDEWVPPKKNKKSLGRKRDVRISDEEGEDEDDDESDAELQEEDEEDELLSGMPEGRGQKRKGAGSRSRSVSRKKSRTKRFEAPKDASGDAIENIETTADTYDDEERLESERLWREVRSRQSAAKADGQSDAGKQQDKTSEMQNRPASQLDQWLGVKPPSWPATCPEAMINDRDSLFVGFVYTLNAPSQAEITQCLSHLTKVVQPQVVPASRLPPSMQHLAPNRRGAQHDMYAWRSLALKKGRNGLGGPDDFGLEEGQEDDGERYGAKEIAKVIRMYGATDILVVVSRWYGGTLLGPVRFRHIEDCAKAALGRYMVNEAMGELREELRALDERIAELKGGSNATPSNSNANVPNRYENLDPDRAQRLVVARKKQIEMLLKPKKVPTQPTSQLSNYEGSPVSRDPRVDDPAHDDAEEAAGLQALEEMEAELANHSFNPAPGPEPEPQPPEAGLAASVKKEADDGVSTRLEETTTANVKEEPIDYDPQSNKVLAKPVSDDVKPKEEIVTPLRVKEEDAADDVDLTGWDEL